MALVQSEVFELLLFQSTPANFTAGDHRAARLAVARTCFNPRPPISQRATANRLMTLLMSPPFQSTPANFTAGDARNCVSMRCNSEPFQSTPANFTAGDAMDLIENLPVFAFQSTPANFTAGDNWGPGAPRRRTSVSIHARQFHSGRPHHLPAARLAVRFQSTPANFTAGDAEWWSREDAGYLFQSTPANFTADRKSVV